MITLAIRRSTFSDTEECFLYETVGDEIFSLIWDRKNRAWERKMVGKECDIIKDVEPTFILFSNSGRKIKKAIADALAENGIVSESHEGARAKLEVVTRHLEDMRTLVFKKNNL